MNRILKIAGLILLGAGSRLIPHLPNMTAMGAVALKSRAEFGQMGLLIPLASMLLSDLVIGLYDWKLLASVYCSFVLIGTLGQFMHRGARTRNFSVTILGSVVFFLITNIMVWALSTWYPHTLSGLLACLLAGLPFLAPMMIGDIVFMSVLFRKTSRAPVQESATVALSA